MAQSESAFSRENGFSKKTPKHGKMFISTTKGGGGLEVDSKGATLHASLEVDVNQTFYDGLGEYQSVINKLSGDVRREQRLKGEIGKT